MELLTGSLVKHLWGSLMASKATLQVMTGMLTIKVPICPEFVNFNVGLLQLNSFLPNLL